MKNTICSFVLLISLSLSSMSEAEEIKRHSDIPKKVYYEFIKSVNPKLSSHDVKGIYKDVEYRVPRYFGVDGYFEEGLVYTLAMTATESGFRNINGDEGLSIGFLQVTLKTCNTARRYNNIYRELNLIDRGQNIWCGMAEFNRLTEYYDHNWEKAVRAYNAGTGGVRFWEKYKGKDISHLLKKNQKAWKKLNFQTERHWKRVSKYRDILLKGIKEYEEKQL